MFFLRLLSHLPFPVLYTFSDFLFFMAYYVVRYRRHLVIKNLQSAFPDVPVKTIEKYEKAFYRNLCDYAVETIKLMTISAEELKQRMVFKNPELVREYAGQNQSILLLTSHQFNWEWLLASGCLYLPIQVDYVYQRQSSSLFDQFLIICRTRFGAYPIERSLLGREAIRRKDILRGIAIMADQFPGREQDKKYWTEFMGQRTAFFLGLGQLAYMTQYPAIFYGVKRIKRGYYEAEGFLVSSPPYEKESQQSVEGYVKATEKIIRQQPDGWLWSHNRWKSRE